MFKKVARVLLIILGVLEILLPLYTVLDTGYASTSAFIVAIVYGVLKAVLCFSVSVLLNETDELKEKLTYIRERIARLEEKDQ